MVCKSLLPSPAKVETSGEQRRKMGILIQMVVGHNIPVSTTGYHGKTIHTLSLISLSEHHFEE